MIKPDFHEGELWSDEKGLPNHVFVCGYCSEKVASIRGWSTTTSPHQRIYICPNCMGPTFFGREGNRYPGMVPGSAVRGLPANLESLYDEARHAAGVGAHTASVLVSRKMLMNIAVAEGAAEGLRFIQYVEYLAGKGYVPPKGQGWVDYIRTRGNEATHEIADE